MGGTQISKNEWEECENGGSREALQVHWGRNIDPWEIHNPHPTWAGDWKRAHPHVDVDIKIKGSLGCGVDGRKAPWNGKIIGWCDAQSI